MPGLHRYHSRQVEALTFEDQKLMRDKEKLHRGRKKCTHDQISPELRRDAQVSVGVYFLKVTRLGEKACAGFK